MSDECKRLVKIISLLGLAVFAAGVFFINNHLYYALGVALGTFISAARIVLLERTLKKSVDMAPADAQNYTRLHYSLRMIATVVVTVIAFKVKYIHIVGYILGLLLVQPAVYISKLFVRKNAAQE